MSGDASEVRGRGCKRLSSLGGGACGMHTSGTERLFFVLLCASALVLLHSHLSRSVWEAGGASTSLLSAVVLVICIQAESGRTGVCFCGLPHLHFPI